MKSNFLQSCCRVCLIQEENMIYIYDTVEEFNKTLSSLLESCGGLNIDSSDSYSKLICEDCTKELMIAAKFREKCQTAKKTLTEYSEMQKPIEVFEASKNEKQIVAEIVSDETHLVQTKVPPESKIIEFDDENDELLEENDVLVEKKEVKVEDSIIETTYEEVEYLDSNIMEIYSLNSTKNKANEANNKGDFLIDDIIEETDEDDIQINFEPETLEDEDPLKQNYDVIIIEDPHNSPIEGYVKVKMAQELNKVVVNHTCDFCGAGFTHLNNLQRHMLQTHQETDAIYVCGECALTFTDQKSFISHLNLHTKIKSEVDLKESAPMTTEKRIKNSCPYCGKGFASKSLLMTHERVHTGERPYKCSFCDKSFTTQGGLDLHTRRHEGRKPFVCNYCNKRFVESSNLKVHMRIHTGEKPHRCNRCDRSFSRVFLLQIHQRTHTGERPYSCPHCKKAFAQQGDLAAHKRIHTGERPHTCLICGKGFIKSSGLTAHMRRHDNEIRIGTVSDEDASSMIDYHDSVRNETLKQNTNKNNYQSSDENVNDGEFYETDVMMLDENSVIIDE